MNTEHESIRKCAEQAAEIERLTTDRDTWKARAEFSYSERDQLKAKNQKLEDALRELMGWQVKNVKVWSNSAYDNASRALKENT